MRWLSFLFFLIIFYAVQAQVTDTVQAPPVRDTAAANLVIFPDTGHSPKKAAFLSAVLPGAGQFYNEKYWKIPVIYAGLGATAYLVIFNRKYKRFYIDAYLANTDTIPGNNLYVDPDGDSISHYSPQDLLEYKDFYKRNLNISAIAFSLIYTLNILDAIVDAHLYEFDISEDLGMRVEPFYHASGRNRSSIGGVTISLKFR